MALPPEPDGSQPTARAMVGERRPLLPESPSGGLDSITRESVMPMIRDARRDGMAAVVVTQDASLASLADRVDFIHDGRLLAPDRTERTRPYG